MPSNVLIRSAKPKRPWKIADYAHHTSFTTVARAQAAPETNGPSISASVGERIRILIQPQHKQLSLERTG